MARTTFSTANYINVGSGATLDNLNVATVLAWGTYASSGVAGTIYSKGGAATKCRFLRQAATDRFEIEISRTGADLVVRADDANCVGLGTNKWVFMAATWDLSLTSADQKIFTGDRGTACAEPSSYSSQSVGDSAKNDEAALDASIGIFNAATPSVPWQGALGIVQVLNVQLTLAEIRSWQWYPRWMPGTVGLWVPGWDDGVTVPDLSGNGNAGTLVGSTVRSADVPLPLLESLFGDADDAENESWDVGGISEITGAMAGTVPFTMTGAGAMEYAGAMASNVVLTMSASGTVGAATTTGGWPDRRRRARAAIYILRGKGNPNSPPLG